MLKKALVITSSGLGDGLMMMVASERLRSHGYTVFTMNAHLHQLQSWFPGHYFQYPLMGKELEQFIKTFDLTILQNDNTERSKEIIQLHKQGVIRSLAIFYSSYESKKHPPLTYWDVVFNSKRPMVENIAKAVAVLLRSLEISTNNGMKIPSYLQFRRYPKRVIIHPTASTSERMWPIESFIELAKMLKEADFDPVFSLSQKERAFFDKNLPKEIFCPKISNLSDLAELIYESGYVIGNESGIVHLASNLQIPNLVIAGHEKRIMLWRPGWLLGQIITPSKWIPNIKHLRLREERWKDWIKPKKVEKSFRKLTKKIDNF
jgi:heptosyltransferase-3